MGEPFWEFPVRLPRDAFSSREVARAGELWRACQDVAVWASSRQGWPPSRFNEEGTAFVVYRMTAVHARETKYDDALVAKTWVSRLRRRTLCTREMRLWSDQGPLLSATQEWVHVGRDLKPTQASAEAAAAFPEHDGGPSVELPEYESVPGDSTTFSFEMWHTWGDALGHANHPDYVDWCDEATSRVMRAGGVDPVLLQPVAERVLFKHSVEPGETVQIQTTRAGRTTAGDVVLVHRLQVAGGELAAEATTVRRLARSDGGALFALWGGSSGGK